MRSYSRRELYALGETLGNSATEKKLGGGYICGGGGGGGQQQAPTQQNITNTSIPEYARPYVENTLGQAQAVTDINQNPYQAYQGQRIADFSPMQQQAFSDVANMQPAQQIGQATGLAGAAGLGSMGVGRQYQRMATDPNAVGAYMNPYLQQSLAPQLAEIQRQGNIQQAQAQGNATQRGAFGGSREALMSSEAQRNALNAQQQALGQGYNTAFQNAQQAQQFGANLGLQGYGQGLQAANTLGQLGQNQYQQQLGINQEQQKIGAVEQAQAQQGLDVAYQNFNAQKNYPYQQLAFMSDMLRGLPLSQASQQIYNAPPNAMSQLGGLGMSALGIYGASGGFKGAKAGGAVKNMAKGGLAYATGGDISMMSDKQLMELLNNPEITPLEAAQIEKILMIHKRIENNPESGKILGVPPSPTERSGLSAIGSGDTFEGSMATGAGGGVVAFAAGKSVKRPEDEMDYTSLIKEEIANLRSNKNDPFAKSNAELASIKQGLEDRKKTEPWMALAQAGLGTMAGTSQYALTNLGGGGQKGLEYMQKSAAEDVADRKLLAQQAVEQEKSKYGRDMGNLNAMISAQTSKDNKTIGLMNARNAAGAAAGARQDALFQKASEAYQKLVADTANKLMQDTKKGFVYKNNQAKAMEDARKEVYESMPQKSRDLLGLTDPTKIITPQPDPGKGTPPPNPNGNAQPQPGPKVPPADAINQLKSSNTPTARQQFDAIFGAGSADKYAPVR